MDAEIATFRAEHAPRFAELNRQWLEAYNLMEPSEEDQLADPHKHFVEGGGQIFVALFHGDVVGTCAVLPTGPGELEVAKLTVAPPFRGRGLARRLVERCIAYGREQGVHRLMLLSNSQLQPALRLYQSLGFEYCPVPEDAKYSIADVCMFLDLTTSDAV